LLPCLLLSEAVLRRGRHWQFALSALAFLTFACVLPTNWLSEQGWNLGVWLLQGKHFWAAAVIGAAVWRCNPDHPDPPPFRVSRQIGKRMTENAVVPVRNQRKIGAAI